MATRTRVLGQRADRHPGIRGQRRPPSRWTVSPVRNSARGNHSTASVTSATVPVRPTRARRAAVAPPRRWSPRRAGRYAVRRADGTRRGPAVRTFGVTPWIFAAKAVNRGGPCSRCSCVVGNDTSKERRRANGTERCARWSRTACLPASTTRNSHPAPNTGSPVSAGSLLIPLRAVREWAQTHVTEILEARERTQDGERAAYRWRSAAWGAAYWSTCADSCRTSGETRIADVPGAGADPAGEQGGPVVRRARWAIGTVGSFAGRWAGTRCSPPCSRGRDRFHGCAVTAGAPEPLTATGVFLAAPPVRLCAASRSPKAGRRWGTTTGSPCGQSTVERSGRGRGGGCAPARDGRRSRRGAPARPRR